MVWRIYKEGQGKWLRGSMAALIFIGAILAVTNIHDLLGRIAGAAAGDAHLVKLPLISWKVDWRWFVDAPVLVAMLIWAVSLYNKPKVVDFLIETENELKNRVTWPTRKEEVNASMVVVVTVVIMMLFIFGIDQLFSFLTTKIYH